MKKSKEKLLAYKIGIIFIGLLAVVSIAYGAGFWDSIKDLVAEKIASQVGPPPEFEEPAIGSVVGPDMTFQEMSFNNNRYDFRYKRYDIAGTSTLCSFQVTATSSLVNLSVTSLKATTSATRLIIATSTSPMGTSSAGVISAPSKMPIAALTGKKFFWTADSSTWGADGLLLYPKQYVIVSNEGLGSYSGWELNGECAVTLRKF